MKSSAKNKVGRDLIELALQESSFDHIPGKHLITDGDGNSYEWDCVLNKITLTWNNEAYKFSDDLFVASYIDASNAILNGCIMRLGENDELQEIRR